MKKLLYFILGFISAIVLLFFVVFIFMPISTGEVKEQIVYLEEPKEFSSSRVFEVQRVIADTSAIAYEMKWYDGADVYMQTNMKVLITNDNGEYYYDNQRINVPRGKKIEQIGVYHDYSETIPIIKIAD
jgi:hypothetical protein